MRGASPRRTGPLALVPGQRAARCSQPKASSRSWALDASGGPAARGPWFSPPKRLAIMQKPHSEPSHCEALLFGWVRGGQLVTPRPSRSCDPAELLLVVERFPVGTDLHLRALVTGAHLSFVGHERPLFR